MHSESCKSHCNGCVKVALGGGFAALCVHSESRKSHCNGGETCKSHCNGGFKVALMVGLRRCARRKCIQRVGNRIVMVVSNP